MQRAAVVSRDLEGARRASTQGGQSGKEVVGRDLQTERSEVWFLILLMNVILM